jgi:hypothetical protein
MSNINKLKVYLTNRFLDQGAKDFSEVEVPKEYYEQSHDEGLTYEESAKLLRTTWEEFVFLKGVTLGVYMQRTFRAKRCI